MHDDTALPHSQNEEGDGPITKSDLFELWKRIESRFDPIESQLEGIQSRLDTVESAVGKLDTRIDAVESRLDSLDSRLSSVELRLDSLESRLDSVESRLDSVESNTMATRQSVDNLAEQIAIFRGEVQAAVEENRNHFDVAVEHIRSELEGANRDEISALQDGVGDLRVRVAALEEERPTPR